MMPQVQVETAGDFYDSRTGAILRRYGPGPRVHYHTGLVDALRLDEASVERLKQKLIDSQVLALHHAAEIWSLRSIAFADVVDVGCGLGGGSIFLAEQFGACVTAITNVPAHVEWVRRFAARTKVASRVKPSLCDAVLIPGKRRFDAAVAVDSSSSLVRRAWFQCLTQILRPAGHVLIYDCFLGQSHYEDAFNRHWCARIGTLDEYLAVAREAGFRLKTFEDVSHRTRDFWILTAALYEAERREGMLTSREQARFDESLEVHSLMRRGLCDGGLRYALASFVKE
jgi:tocopherol O-methyltransferase